MLQKFNWLPKILTKETEKLTALLICSHGVFLEWVSILETNLL